MTFMASPFWLASGAAEPDPGQIAYVSNGSFTVPDRVTELSILVIAPGQGVTSPGRGGNGGGLTWANGIIVAPGDVINIQITSLSSIVRRGTQFGTMIIQALGTGGGAQTDAPGLVSFGGGNGGIGGNYTDDGTLYGGGGGGAGGYSGNGGNGGNGSFNGSTGTAGSGSGGGGGYGGGRSGTLGGGGGGGTGILGAGSNGTAGTFSSAGGGVGGLGGTNGASPTNKNAGAGGNFGGGAGSMCRDGGGTGGSAAGGPGVVRIMWGGGRSYPNNAPNV